MTQTSTTITVDSLPTANSVDRTQDRLLIYTASATDIQGIAPNTMLGLSGNPVGTTDSQTLSTKVLDNSNTITLKDTLFTLQDDGDTTKQAKFQLSGLTTATTRTYTLPDVSDTLVSLTATQTLTNKTLTSPTISSPTITNATISTDTITGFTTSNTGTIYGISISAGVLSTANSIAAGTIVQNGVAASQLATSAITLGESQVTTGQASITTETDLTGLSVTVTVPAGGRKVKITASVVIDNSVTTDTSIVYIKEGSTYLQSRITWQASGYKPLEFSWTGTPTAGSHTYKVSLARNSGTGTTSSNAGVVASTVLGYAFIRAEAV